MKKVVRYLLEGNGVVPSFVESGGHFPVGEEFVGVSVDTSKRHMPSTVQVLTKEQLVLRVKTNVKHLITKQALSDAEALERVENFLESVNLLDYE